MLRHLASYPLVDAAGKRGGARVSYDTLTLRVGLARPDQMRTKYFHVTHDSFGTRVTHLVQKNAATRGPNANQTSGDLVNSGFLTKRLPFGQKSS